VDLNTAAIGKCQCFIIG